MTKAMLKHVWLCTGKGGRLRKRKRLGPACTFVGPVSANRNTGCAVLTMERQVQNKDFKAASEG
eukprot:1261976-Amphidinium_carterae.1